MTAAQVSIADKELYIPCRIVHGVVLLMVSPNARHKKVKTVKTVIFQPL